MKKAKAKRNKKILIITLLGLVLSGCPPTCEPVEYNFGTLTREALELVPYEDGKTYTLRHSAGHEIKFSCQRESFIENEFWDPCATIRYEKNTTALSPDYPIFDMAIYLRKDDSLRYSAKTYIGQSSFLLPFNHDYGVEYSHFDSLEFDGTWHRDVYVIERNTYYTEESGIYPDSLWYNTAGGILKVGMSNDEYYQLIPDDE